MTFDRKTYNREWRRRRVAADPAYLEREKAAIERYRAKILPILAADPDHPLHGHAGTYVTGCRCVRCTEAHRVATAEWREGKQT